MIPNLALWANASLPVAVAQVSVRRSWLIGHLSGLTAEAFGSIMPVSALLDPLVWCRKEVYSKGVVA